MDGPQVARDKMIGDFERQVAIALERIRPALQADGGDIELLAVAGRDVHVRLVGACVG